MVCLFCQDVINGNNRRTRITRASGTCAWIVRKKYARWPSGPLRPTLCRLHVSAKVIQPSSTPLGCMVQYKDYYNGTLTPSLPHPHLHTTISHHLHTITLTAHRAHPTPTDTLKKSYIYIYIYTSHKLNLASWVSCGKNFEKEYFVPL